MYRFFFKNIIFNDLFVLNLLNVASRYIFKCERAAKVENGEEYLVFWMIRSFFGVCSLFNWKIGEFQLVMPKFSAFSGAKSNGRYIFQLLRSLKDTGRYISQL